MIELHILADSFSKVDGAVSYLRVISSNSITCEFISGKARLIPLKEKLLTIPKLELQAALTSLRMKVTLGNSLDLVFDSIHLWTDSKIVIQHITSDNSKYSPYVMYRKNKTNQTLLLYRGDIFQDI